MEDKIKTELLLTEYDIVSSFKINGQIHERINESPVSLSHLVRLSLKYYLDNHDDLRKALGLEK